MTTEYTKTPWQAGLDLPLTANNNPDPRLVWSGSMLVADFRTKWVSEEVARANAALAALAVNTHADLATALMRCRRAMVTLAALAGSDYNRGVPWAKLDTEARSILTKVKG